MIRPSGFSAGPFPPNRFGHGNQGFAEFGRSLEAPPRIGITCFQNEMVELLKGGIGRELFGCTGHLGKAFDRLAHEKLVEDLAQTEMSPVASPGPSGGM